MFSGLLNCDFKVYYSLSPFVSETGDISIMHFENNPVVRPIEEASTAYVISMSSKIVWFSVLLLRS